MAGKAPSVETDLGRPESGRIGPYNARALQPAPTGRSRDGTSQGSDAVGEAISAERLPNGIGRFGRMAQTCSGCRQTPPCFADVVGGEDCAKPLSRRGIVMVQICSRQRQRDVRIGGGEPVRPVQPSDRRHVVAVMQGRHALGPSRQRQ